MKTIGLIGGTSWHSTIDYYRYINQLTEQRLGHPPKNPPLLLYSQNVDLMRRGDWDEIRASYLQVAKTLQQAGAEALLICANTPHKVIPFVEPQIDIPFIHIADAIGEQAQRLSLQKLALLGTFPTMEEDFISAPLAEKHDIQTIVPKKRSRAQIHRFIAEELTQGIFKDETKAYFIDEMEALRQEGIDGVILGCTELPMLLKEGDFDLPLLDTTYLHAGKAVAFILG